MTREEITAKVFDVVCSFTNVDKDKLDLQNTFKDDLGMDSLDMADLAQAMEDAFSLTLEYEDLENMKSIEDAISYLEKKVG